MAGWLKSKFLGKGRIHHSPRSTTRVPFRGEILEPRALLTTLVVSSVLDEANGDTSSIAALQSNPGEDGISLREAIIAANNTAGANEILFDKVTFAAQQSINLLTSLPPITEAAEIVGPGAEVLTVSGGGNGFRLLDVDDGDPNSTIPIRISGITFTGGAAIDFGLRIVPLDNGMGGAVRNSEDLTLRDVIVTGNVAEQAGGGIYNVGTLSLEASVVDSNSTIGTFGALGGGVFNDNGTVTIRDSSIVGNASLSGGGVVNQAGTLSILSSSVRENTATEAAGFGGGVANLGGAVSVRDAAVSGNFADNGGAIFNDGGDVDIVHSTLSSNVAATHFGDGGGGLLNKGGSVSFVGSTISNNTASNGVGGLGGGVFNDGGKVHLLSTTVFQNWAEQGGGIFNQGDAGSIQLSNSILSENNSGNLTGVVAAGDHNLIGSDVVILGRRNIVSDDPGLGPLQNNGGPTETHLVNPSSPAVNSGDNSLIGEVTTDQRGEPRIQNGTVDIGAVESRFGTASPVLPDSDFNNDGTSGCQDVNMLTTAIAEGNDNRLFDLTGDALVDPRDLDAWLVEAGTVALDRPFLKGDANLDGRVTSADLNAMALNWQQDDSRWCGGDFSADGKVTAADMNLLALNWQQGVDPPTANRRGRLLTARR